MFGLKALWVKTLTPLFSMLPVKTLIAAIIEGMVRTGVLLIIGMTIIYFWHISPEINGLIEKSLKKLKRD